MLTVLTVVGFFWSRLSFIHTFIYTLLFIHYFYIGYTKTILHIKQNRTNVYYPWNHKAENVYIYNKYTYKSIIIFNIFKILSKDKQPILAWVTKFLWHRAHGIFISVNTIVPSFPKYAIANEWVSDIGTVSVVFLSSVPWQVSQNFIH